MQTKQLKEGVVLKVFGAANPITNENLTDEIVEWYSEKNPEHAAEIFEPVNKDSVKNPEPPKK